MEAQVALTMPILPGTDGVEKMSKSLDNYIGINESPQQIYGKTLSIPDKLIYEYFVLATNLPAADLASIKAELDNPANNPRNTKRRLARELVALYHSREAAKLAEEEFDRIFVKKDLPDEVPERAVSAEGGTIGIIKLLTEAGLVSSNSEARRMVDQGAVSVDGNKVVDPNALINLERSAIVKVGKRRFARVSKA
jgi:tyrosyl-tRNA synthetase